MCSDGFIFYLPQDGTIASEQQLQVCGLEAIWATSDRTDRANKNIVDMVQMRALYVSRFGFRVMLRKLSFHWV